LKEKLFALKEGEFASRESEFRVKERLFVLKENKLFGLKVAGSDRRVASSC
jgi:hypothetical protein